MGYGDAHLCPGLEKPIAASVYHKENELNGRISFLEQNKDLLCTNCHSEYKAIEQ